MVIFLSLAFIFVILLSLCYFRCKEVYWFIKNVYIVNALFLQTAQTGLYIVCMKSLFTGMEKLLLKFEIK